jgi:hypothetical protein
MWSLIAVTVFIILEGLKQMLGTFGLTPVVYSDLYITMMKVAFIACLFKDLFSDGSILSQMTMTLYNGTIGRLLVRKK